MKKILSVLAIVFTLNFAISVHAQTPSAPTVPTISWSVAGQGMPGNLQPALASQWTAAIATATASADTSEVAFVQAQQTAVNAKLTWFAANAPTVPVSVRVSRRVTYAVPSEPKAQFMFTVVQITGFVN